jgi:hypothetical protein
VGLIEENAMATSTDLRCAIEEVQQQLPAEQLSAEGQLALGDGDWASRIERRVGALPWWVISAATHAVLFLLIALLATAVAPPMTDEVIISTDVVKQKPPEYDPEKKRDIFKNTKDVQAENQVENPVVTHEKTEESDHFETDNNMDKKTSRGSEDAISDIPLGGTGTVGSIGVGGGGMAGVFGYRDGGGRKKAVGRFGGSQATESAVEAALRWLARHQEADGHWDAVKYESAGYEPHMGCTGLAVLAFLGAGYTHKSGQFSENVDRALKWMLANQKKDGAICFNDWGRPAGSYGHAIAGLALAEAYGMSRDEKLREPAQRAVQYSIATMQQPYSGWRYFPKGQDDDYLADMSVTGWYVMQLKSAKIAGLTVDGSGFQGAAKFVDSVTDKSGQAGYAGPASDRPAMTSVAMVARQFMGIPSSDPLLVGGAKQLLTSLPQWQDPTDLKDFYYVYYGTLGMFQMGGDKWTKWNEVIKPLLVNNQCKGPLPLSSAATDKDGSWDPYGHSGKLGGRVFMTAMGALTMEVYYRYLPMYAGK